MELNELLMEAETKKTKESNGNTSESKPDYWNSDNTYLKTMP